MRRLPQSFPCLCTYFWAMPALVWTWFSNYGYPVCSLDYLECLCIHVVYIIARIVGTERKHTNGGPHNPDVLTYLMVKPTNWYLMIIQVVAHCTLCSKLYLQNCLKIWVYLVVTWAQNRLNGRVIVISGSLPIYLQPRRHRASVYMESNLPTTTLCESYIGKRAWG